MVFCRNRRMRSFSRMLLFGKHRFRILLHMQGSYNRMVHVCRGPCSMIHRCCLLSLSTGQLQKMARVNIIPHTACWGPLLVVPIDCSQRLLVCGIRGLHTGLYIVNCIGARYLRGVLHVDCIPSTINTCLYEW